VTASVSGILRDSSHLRQARSRCLRCCPRVAVTALGLPPHRARGGHAHLGQMQRFGPSSRLVTIDGVSALMVFKTGVVSSISWCPSCANGNLLCHRLALIPHISRVLTTSLQIAVSARAVTAYQGCGALGSVREVPQRSEVNGRLMARQDCPGPGRKVPEDHGWDIRDDVQRRAAAARWRAHR